jgi:hypothetical protein
MQGMGRTIQWEIPPGLCVATIRAVTPHFDFIQTWIAVSLEI